MLPAMQDYYWRKKMNNEIFYSGDTDLTIKELKEVKAYWTKMSKSMTREQLIQTAVDNRSMTSPIYEAMIAQLGVMARADQVADMKREFGPALAAEKEYLVKLKKHKAKLKAGKKSVKPKRNINL
jgi:hypothetical protein